MWELLHLVLVETHILCLGVWWRITCQQEQRHLSGGQALHVWVPTGPANTFKTNRLSWLINPGSSNCSIFLLSLLTPSHIWTLHLAFLVAIFKSISLDFYSDSSHIGLKFKYRRTIKIPGPWENCITAHKNRQQVLQAQLVNLLLNFSSLSFCNLFPRDRWIILQ